MSVRPAAPPAARIDRRLTRAALLGGVSLLALAVAAPAGARDILRSGVIPTPSTITAATSSAAAQAQAAAKTSTDSLRRAAQAMSAARAAAAQIQLANPLPAVPNGLTPGGLVPDPGIGTDPSLWQGALAPVQTVANSQTTVSIQQTQPKAILNWQTFNVGSSTTVDFVQRDSNGVHSDWVALNRINDPAAAPSQILGKIHADGSVLVINRNGIIFGGGAQVNVHSLVASSLDVGDFNATRAQRDQFFLNSGIAAQATGANSFSSTYSPTGTQADGDVVVQSGATITTDVAQPDNPGFIYLFGGNVANAGTLSSPAGEVAMVAARSVALTPGTYRANSTATNPNSAPTTILGTGFTLNHTNVTTTTPYLDGTGTATNSGVIETPRGITIMNGDRVVMSGAISADTSITRSSKIFLDAVTATDITGTISILPYENGETLPLSGSTTKSDGSVQTFIPPAITASAYDVTVGGGALIVAPSATVSLTGVGGGATGNFDLLPKANRNTVAEEVRVASGATIDVSGLQDVQLSASYNFITIQPRGQDLANSPLQRDGVVAGQSLIVDIRASGTSSDGTTWVGTPLFDASGYIGLVPQSIDQLMTAGGSIVIKTDTNRPALNKVTLEQGALLNVHGGYVEFLPGLVSTTRLIGADGRVYDISKADPTLTYVGILGQTTVTHPRAGVTDVFTVPLVNPTVAQAGYTEGRDAGGISVETNLPTLNATMLFGSVAGDRQHAAGRAPSGVTSTGAPKQQSPYELPSQGYFALRTPSSVVIGQGPTSALYTSNNSSNRVALSATQLSGYGLSGISIAANDLTLTSGDTLSLAPGGQFSATTYGAIDIEGTVRTPGGKISLLTDPFSLDKSLTTSVPATAKGTVTASGAADIVNPTAANVFVGGELDARGLWVNDTGLADGAIAGPAFINGGSISIATNYASNGVDTTGSIILANGSLLDVSSGGYINQKGALSLNSAGLPKGQGGNISLLTYQGPAFDPLGSSGPLTPTPDTTPTKQTVARIRLGGALRGYGFAGGGTLTIGAPGLIQVGGTPQNLALENDLATSIFTSGGFGSYVIHAVNDSRGDPSSFFLANNTTLVLQQQTYSNVADYSGVATGSDISQVASLVALTDDLRPAVNLTVSADNIVLGAGSAVLADAGAKITLKQDLSNAGTALLLGDITDHAGQFTINSAYVWLGADSHIDLSGTYIANSTFGQAPGYAVSGKVLSGGSLTIDTGTLGTSTTGYVVAQNGATVDVSGASGVLTTLGGPGSRAGSGPSAGVATWTDGGTVSINTRTLLWDGTFKADAGDPQGNRGTAIIGGSTLVLQQATDNAAFDVRAEIASLATSATSVANANTLINGSKFSGGVFAAADKFGAFDTQYLYGGSGGLQFFSSANATTALRGMPVKINGDLNWTVNNRLFLEGSDIEPMSDGTTVTLSAPYVMLQQGTIAASILPTSGTSTLTVNAQTIDIGSAVLSKFASTNFNSTGDIRLMSAPVIENSVLVNGVPRNPSVFYGEVLSAGDVGFLASRIYPVSAVDFEIVSTSPTGTITFNAPAGSAPETPLSAGGRVTVSGASIVQNGNLLAPLGQIVLGARTVNDLSANDPFKGAANYPFVATGTVTLGAGSITSVSLGNTLVPYGQTEDGTNWFYNDSVDPLGAPPAKSLRLLGKDITVTDGAIMDLRGGGDLQAIEFVPGKGGSVDVLAAASGKPAVYALLPSRSDAVAAFDIDFTAYLRDTQPLAGQKVYLSGGNGITAGFYTLYPAHYATLPGALRLVDYGSTLSKPGQLGQTLPDGTQLIGGYYTQSTLPGSRSAGTELFAVQTAATWRLYSEIDSTSANSYFAAKAIHDGIAAPSLPIDGGRLTIGALNTLDLGAPALSLPATGGRGGELDLSGAKLELVGAGQTADTGYTGIDVTQLNVSGFQSILVGGERSDTADGTLITTTATDIVVDTRGTALSVPELILSAAAPTTTVTATTTPDAGSTTTATVTVTTPVQSPNPSGNITVRSGSIVEAASNAAQGPARHYVLGTAAPTGPLTQSQVSSYTAAANGGFGALLLVSSNPDVTVTRLNPFPEGLTIAVKNGTTSFGTLTIPALHDNVGFLTVESGAQIAGGENMVLDATAKSRAITIGPAATIGANAVSVGASSIGLGANPLAPDGVVIAPAILNEFGAGDRLALKTYGGNINFYGSVEVDPTRHLKELVLDTPALVGGSGDVTIGSGGTLTLVNSGIAATGVVPHVGTLTLDAGEIDFGGGDIALAGFESVNWRASQRIFAKSSGTVRVGIDAAPVDLSIETPNVLVGGKTSGGSGQASQFVVTTLGNVTLTRPTGAAVVPAATDEIGGNFLVIAGSIVDRGTIQAIGGTVNLHATSGDVTLGDGALIAAGGAARTLIDVIEYVSGGKVVLTSDTANVALASGSTVDLSQPAGGIGRGGELDVVATSGNAVVDGTIKAAGGPGLGGTFRLDARGAVSLDDLATRLGNGGVTDTVDIHTREGNLVLSQGKTLTAHDLTLTADDPIAGQGQVTIAGTIDASGYAGTLPDKSTQAGGSVGIWGRNAITLASTGKVLANTARSDELGGDVEFGIPTNALGVIDLQSGSIIDVSGGTVGGLTGGTVHLRAPVLIGQNDVAIGSIGSTINGARSVVVEPFVAIDTKPGSGLWFDGIVDPAGLYDGTGKHIDGFWKDASGNVVGVEYGGQRYTAVNGSFVINPQWLDPDQGNAGGVFAAANLAFTSDPNGQKVVVPATITDNQSLYNQDHIAFFQTTIPEYVQGNFPGLGFANTESRFASVRSELPSGVFHIRPGGELDNSNLSINNGDITIASAWNLAAGIALDVSTPSPATSIIQFLYRYGLEPINLTMRAVRDINVNASLTDGFFQFHNYSDSRYQAALSANGFLNAATLSKVRTITQQPSFGVGYYLNSYVAPPQAPYDAAANGASPVATLTYNSAGTAVVTSDMNPLGNADLFPKQLNVYNTRDGQVYRGVSLDSASIRLVAGADMASANPNAVGSLSLYGDTSSNALARGHGNVTIDKHATYTQNFRNPTGTSSIAATLYAPTMVRTGTGDIVIAAARDVILADHYAPGIIVAAGRNTALLADPQYSVQGTGTAAKLVAGNPNGFLEPQLLYYGAQSFPAGPLTAAAFPEKAGDIDISAGRDIIGFQNVVLNNEPTTNGFDVQNNLANYQFYAPWLLSMSQITAQPSTVTNPVATGAGVFAPSGTQAAEQSAWWIQFGSFDQGVLSAGGDVRVTAGRDMRDFSVSLPSTGRVSGGLAAGNTPVLHRYDSGDLTVRVGRDLYSGSFYEGTGTASIIVGGSVRPDWTGQSYDNVSAAAIKIPVATVLAVDSGQINLTAAGSIAITNIINPAELHPQTSFTIGGSANSVFMDTYGPDSAVRLTSVGGDVNLDSSPGLLYPQNPNLKIKGAQTYPATLEIKALSGDITTPQTGMVLTSSLGGDFNLLAYGSLDLTGGLPASAALRHRTISAGASLLDTSFSAYQPNNGFSGSTGAPALAHQNDPVDDRYDRLYAVTGDITGNGQVKIARPVLVQAGNDIVDLNLIAQNIRPSDVSAVIAGHDLYYTGFANLGGLQIAGPGFFIVEAGRDLGPFVIAANNTATQQEGITSSGNAAKFPVGNDTANGNDTNNAGLQTIGVSSVAFTGPNGSGKRNFMLPDDGATVVARFGVAPGADYAAVASKYVDPTSIAAADDYRAYLAGLVQFLADHGAAVSPTKPDGSPRTEAEIEAAAWNAFPTAMTATLRNLFVHGVLAYESTQTAGTANYAGALQFFLASVGIVPSSAADAWAKFGTLSPQLQQVFLDKVFFSEIQVAGDSHSGSFGKYQRGYQVVNTLYPASLGYTANALDGGLNGAETMIKTGNLDLLHATIQTDRGGDVLLMGPGGDALLGSIALEPNKNLKLNNVGLLTLAGGSISTFTDGSVLVNQSRVFTEQGGDVLMWSSNADLNAGRGAKTTSSLPPLSVNIDSNNYQSVDLGGLVTGAGIGVLQTSDTAFASDAFLIAPRGTVDAGDAGIRVSGNLSISAAVVLHSDNISVGGAATGVPVSPSVNVAALSAAGSTAAAGANSASLAQPGAGPSHQPLPSIITSEVVGYGMPSDEQIDRLRNQQ